MIDIPEILLSGADKARLKAELTTNEDGIVCGLDEMRSAAEKMDLEVRLHAKTGDFVGAQMIVADFLGSPLNIIRGEGSLLSFVSKVSGVATAARRAVTNAGNIRVVCGAWKKVPHEYRNALRSAAEIGGVESRISFRPFLYMDKNYIRIFRSIEAAIDAARLLPDRITVIQLKGETAPIEEEALRAARSGANIIMVDTGNIPDLRKCSAILRKEGLRELVQISFAGSILLSDIEDIKREDVDIIDVGRAILDAPLLDFRYDICT